jgi:hypothetical protein
LKAGLGIGLAAVALLVGVAATPAGASGGAAKVTAKTACSLTPDEQRHLGASYVYTLKVRNLSCEKGKNLVKKYHQCRKDNGGADGHCGGFKGYSCTEKRESAPQQYSAKAKCVKGDKKFVQEYTQNT